MPRFDLDTDTLLDIAVARPDALLLDEPTAGVDPDATEAITELLQRLNHDGMTLIMVNHDLSVVQRVARRILSTHHGAVTERDMTEMARTAGSQPT